MKASYELTPDDLAAFMEFHNSRSPAVRQQRIGCLSKVVIAMLLLPGLVLATSEKPLMQTAKDIWPLLAAPVLYLAFIVPYGRWRTASLTQQMLREGRNSGFYGACTTSVDPNGICESKELGDTMRKWPAVERFIVTKQHLIVYTSGIEAFVVPFRAFHNGDEADAFVQYIASHSGVEPERV